MNPRIRWIGGFMVVCFVLLFLQLNNIQVRQAKALSKNFLGTVGQVNEFSLPRGAILSSDHKILAYSVASKDKYGQQRIYPPATAYDFGQLTGYVDTTVFSAPLGLEAQYDSYLSQHDSATNTLHQLLTQHKETDNVTLTVSSTLQADAANLLKGRAGGAIAAIDPRTGAVLALYGDPSFDPNVLAQHNAGAVAKAFAALSRQNPQPFVSLGSAEVYAPGSTFKVIDTAGIFDHVPNLANKNFPPKQSITIPGSNKPFHNFNGETCGGKLPVILAQSCDTAYALVGLGLGARNVINEAEHFGWCVGTGGQCKQGSRPPLDLPSSEVLGATIDPESTLAPNPAFLAYSSIGQFDDRATALSMALVAAGIADNGKIMAPHLMSRITDSSGNTVRVYTPHVWKQATSSKTAQQVRTLMLGVTNPAMKGTAAGTFTDLQSRGIGVAAKTGTAEINTSCATDDWLIAMAPAGPGQTPTVAVAAVVPTSACNVGDSSATGATVAGPIVDQMLADVLRAGL